MCLEGLGDGGALNWGVSNSSLYQNGATIVLWVSTRTGFSLFYYFSCTPPPMSVTPYHFSATFCLAACACFQSIALILHSLPQQLAPLLHRFLAYISPSDANDDHPESFHTQIPERLMSDPVYIHVSRVIFGRVRTSW